MDYLSFDNPNYIKLYISACQVRRVVRFLIE